ncbi:hypothetical protein J2W91_004688 [Paenibacillus amylolyticus]|uniref:Dynamin N-terminal domain-containing protein n=1 Tax=Paenibacillus amylolyticus TaxID=1451 RepID=A0AAP5H5G4_PAEAM|nr:dynamin family protein [Paenibacillus amylolyticus]MDR6726182.1 hypothetical protein [Paenibacillus amylolyticus]
MSDMLTTCREIASYLNDEINVQLLEDLAARQQIGAFYLPIIGQYSAGKSRFINALLEIDYLPTLGTEATAYPTYIAYGETEEAWVEYVDGTVSPVTPQDLKDYRHSEDAYTQFEVLALHLKLKHPILASGLIIVDTPGFNTIVRAHEEITLKVLPQAQFLFYVMGKALTHYDRSLLRKIQDLGIELVFIRTKLDEIKTSEEKLDEFLDSEILRVKNALGSNRPLFGVSGDPEALMETDWQERLEEVRSYMINEMNPQLQELWHKSLVQRLSKLSIDFRSRLMEKREWLTSADTVSIDKLQEQADYLAKQQQILEQSHRSTSTRIQNELSPYHMKISNEALDLQEPRLAAFHREIAQKPSIEAMQQYAQEAAATQVENYIQSVQDMFAGYTQTMIEEGFKGHQQRIQEISEKLQGDLNLPVTFELRIPDVDTMLQERQYAIEQLEAQLEQVADLVTRTDDDLVKFDLNREQVQTMLQEAKQWAAEVSSSVENIEPNQLQMRYVEGDNRVSEALGRLGFIADMLMIFIPGKNTATVATMGGKVAKTTQMSQKLKTSAEVLQTAAKTADKAMKGKELLAKVEKAHDVLLKVKSVQNKVKQFDGKGTSKISGILDFVTAEYWLRKAGKIFDTPSRYELDKQAEAVYQSRKQQMEQKVQTAVLKELKQLEELHMLNAKEDRAKKERELQLRNQSALESQLVAERSKANKEAAVAYARQLDERFENELSKVHVHLKSEMNRLFHYYVQTIVISATLETRERIHAMQENLQQLLTEKQRLTAENDKTIETVDHHLQRLASIIDGAEKASL